MLSQSPSDLTNPVPTYTTYAHVYPVPTRSQEFDRRIQALSDCLTEKAEENINMAGELKKFETQLKAAQDKAARAEESVVEEQDISEEYKRRIDVLR